MNLFMGVVKKSLSGSLFEKTRSLLGRPKNAAPLSPILLSHPGCENGLREAFLKAPPPSDFFTSPFILIFIYCVSRLPIILSNSQTISYELYRGTLALEFLEGLKLPLGNYLTDLYSWAPVFNGLLTVPFFLLFGKSLFALKLVPFCWYLLTLIAWFYVWRLHFSSRETFWILLLFIFAPPGVVQYMVSNHGTHFEMILWTALSILILGRILRKDWEVFKGSLLLGFIGGFSSSLMPTNLVTVAVVLISFTLARRNIKFYIGYAGGFLVGFCPWLIINVNQQWAGLDYPLLEQFFYERSFKQLFYNLWSLFFRGDEGLRGLFGFDELSRPVRLFLSFGYVSVYLFSLITLCIRKWGFWRNIRGRFDVEGFAVIYQIFFLGVILISQYGWAHHYLFPIVPFMGMTIISFLNRSRFFFKTCVIGFCLLCGLIGNFLMIDFKGLGKTQLIQGYSFGELGPVMEHNFGQDLSLFEQKTKNLLKNRPFESKKLFYISIPSDIFAIDEQKDADKILAYIQTVEEELKPILFAKLGIHLGIHLGFDLNQLVRFLKEHEIANVFYPDIYLGFISALNRENLSISEKTQRGLIFCAKAPIDVKQACYEGIGALSDQDYVTSKILNHFPTVFQVPKTYRLSYFLGLGRYFSSIYVSEPEKVKKFMSSFSEDEQAWFKKGVIREILPTEDLWTRSHILEKIMQ